MTSREPDRKTNENSALGTLDCAPVLRDEQRQMVEAANARGEASHAAVHNALVQPPRPTPIVIDPADQKARDLGPKVVSAERAVAAIPAGSRIYVGTGCAAPRSLLAALEAMVPGPPDLEFVSFVTTSALPQGGALAILAIVTGHFSSAAKCVTWRLAVNSTTCLSHWRRCRSF